jgi:hypothetical protein
MGWRGADGRGKKWNGTMARLADLRTKMALKS